MATQKYQTTSNEDKPPNSSGERKIYPITGELLEAGERAFWEGIREERERAKKEQAKK